MNKRVTVYVRNDSTECQKLIHLMEENNIEYDEKNITDVPHNLKQLQEHGVFATPATFIDDAVILGYQEKKLKQNLGIDGDTYNHRIL